MQRMISAIGVVIFVAVIVLGAIWLGDVGESGRDGASGVSVPSQPSATAELDGANVNSNLPLWRIDYSASYIKFVGVQDGAEFEGVWESWSAIQMAVEHFNPAVNTGRIDRNVDSTVRRILTVQIEVYREGLEADVRRGKSQVAVGV